MKWRKLFYKITHWETWDYRIKYYPLAPVWLWHCIRSKAVWWFTPSNPTLTFGGFEGESKKEMYDQLPPGSFPRTIYIDPRISFENAQKLMIENNFSYPFAAKPDVGMMGLMFRKIENEEMFRMYHELIPSTYIVQDYIDLPMEVSIFYCRFPGEKKGQITGFVKKEWMQVLGDGRSTLWELIIKDKRARFRMEELRSKHEKNLSDIIPKGHCFILSNALNLSRGGKLISLSGEIDECLLSVFDGIADHCKYFYYGRYDIKCRSIEDLKHGLNFSILEYNGSGAEPHHVYGMGNNIFQAQAIILKHWNILARISRASKRNGIDYWKYKDGKIFLKKAKGYFNKLKRIDKQMPSGT